MRKDTGVRICLRQGRLGGTPAEQGLAVTTAKVIVCRQPSGFIRAGGCQRRINLEGATIACATSRAPRRRRATFGARAIVTTTVVANFATVRARKADGVYPISTKCRARGARRTGKNEEPQQRHLDTGFVGIVVKSNQDNFWEIGRAHV